MLLTEKQLEERVHALLPLGYVEIAKGDISLVHDGGNPLAV